MATPYVLDINLVCGNVAQTLANLVALRAEITATPKPEYSVHGHRFLWTDLYRYLGEEITRCQVQLSQLQPFEIISVAR